MKYEIYDHIILVPSAIISNDPLSPECRCSQSGSKGSRADWQGCCYQWRSEGQEGPQLSIFADKASALLKHTVYTARPSLC